MSRLRAGIRTDFQVQVRNNLYAIGIIVSVILAIAMAFLARPDQLPIVAAAALILIAGGSTLLYVGAMIVFEKDEGTLRALTVSPVRSWEYLGAKVITLTIIAAIETAIIVGGATVILSADATIPIPNVLLLLLATVAMSVLYTLIGIIMVVRFRSITDYLVPLSFLATILQLPFFYFMGVFAHPSLLAIPTSAPAMILMSAYRPLLPWEWIYGLGYTAVLLVGLSVWANAAFNKHIIGGAE
ncbi:MAG: hypothetical protein ABJN26_07995 [Stappiaceae bacterium]